jgi:hypothetical protein
MYPEHRKLLFLSLCQVRNSSPVLPGQTFQAWLFLSLEAVEADDHWTQEPLGTQGSESPLGYPPFSAAFDITVGFPCRVQAPGKLI